MRDIRISDDVFISEFYCAYLPEELTAVISDLHLGFEQEMNLRGLFLPKLQLKHVEGMVDKIIATYDPERIIINGDFKHAFSKNFPQEWSDAKHFIDRYSHRVELVFIRGNHDNYLSAILSTRNIVLRDSIRLGNFYIYHGDKDLGLKGFTILGHEHPSIVLRDSVGGSYKMPVFAYSSKENLLLLPALSFFSSGADLSTSLISEEHFTPVLKNVDQDSFRVFAITEEYGLIDLGSLSDLRS